MFQSRNRSFLCPCIDKLGHIVFGLSFCSLFVCLFVSKNFYIGHMFSLVRLRAFIFHMSIPCDKPFLFVLSSRSFVKVKVKYQGHSHRKMAIAGALVFHKLVLFLIGQYLLMKVMMKTLLQIHSALRKGNLSMVNQIKMKRVTKNQTNRS